MKYALITGGASGMGRATAVELAKNGFTVFSCDINFNPEERENIIQIKTDVTSEKSVKETFEIVSKITDRLDAVINFAGIIMMNSLIEITEEEFVKIFNVNLFGAFRINKAFFPMVQKTKGKIVITTSELAENKVLPFNAIYAISKKALDAYAQGLAMELGLLGISVVTLRPGAVATPIIKSSSEQMNALNNNTVLYKNTITKFKRFVDKEHGKGISSEKIAKIVLKILNKKKPKLVYKKNISVKLKLLSTLPVKTQIKLLKMILK